MGIASLPKMTVQALSSIFRVGTGEPSVRVRIAPSPTGPLHLGTARTAIFNLLFARKRGGVFILRIEDTDLERSDAAFERDIFEQLHWLGIHWDEGPDVGGKYGPYRASERLAVYAKYAEQLLESNGAYLCFCTKERIDRIRKQQREDGEAPRYDGHCRTIARNEAHARLKQGERVLLRLRIPSEPVSFTDLVRGDITFDAGLLGDIAIAKLNVKRSNSKLGIHALYNFAVAVDDAEMQITHVLRGEDHIPNTPKQMLIARALSLPTPQYGHFPLILGSDRTKLSKRHGATSVREFREAGYFPEAIVNFLTLLGWNPGDEREIFRFQELVEAFDLSRVQQGGAVWNQEKLEWFNRQFLAQEDSRWLATDGSLPEGLLERTERVLQRRGWDATNAQLTALLPIMLERTPLADLENVLTEEYRYMFETPVVDRELLRWKSMTDDDVRQALKRAQEVFETIDEQEWQRERLEEQLLSEAAKWGSGDRGKFLWPLRVALSGKKVSPSPFEIAAILGKEKTLKRLSKILKE